MRSWLPENISTFGGDIDSLFYLILYITGFWFFLTEGLILYFLIKYRRREGRKAAYLPGNTLKQAAWVLIPGLIVLVLDLWIDFRGAEVWAKIKGAVPPSDIRLQVTAKQFNWEVLYPGPDGKFGTEDDLQMDNDIHVPVGKPIHITLKSKDVIHSFFMPHLRLKQDAVPGREIGAWFEATQSGRFEIPCAELCGFGHSGMKGLLIVHTPEEYESWVKERWPQKARARQEER